MGFRQRELVQTDTKRQPYPGNEEERKVKQKIVRGSKNQMIVISNRFAPLPLAFINYRPPMRDLLLCMKKWIKTSQFTTL